MQVFFGVCPPAIMVAGGQTPPPTVMASQTLFDSEVLWKFDECPIDATEKIRVNDTHHR